MVRRLGNRALGLPARSAAGMDWAPMNPPIALPILTQRQHAPWQADVGLATLPSRRRGLIRPVHLRQLLAVRARQPVLQVSQAAAKPPCHGALGLSAAPRRHQRLSFCFRELFTLNTVSD